MQSRGIPWRGAALGLVAATLSLAVAGASREAGAHGGGTPIFRGGSAGTPVPFETVPLPPVDPGGVPETGLAALDPFAPTFDELVEGDVVITTPAQMQRIWDRLFGVPYDATLFDFGTSFVVLMGGGLMHPDIGFSIDYVELFDATFENVNDFKDPTQQPALAVVAVTTLPGPPPKKMPDVYHVAAVRIDHQPHVGILFHRETFFAP